VCQACLAEFREVLSDGAKNIRKSLTSNVAAWACEATCFANNPQPDLQAGLGEMEIKAESLRFIVCVGGDLLQDASFPLESWILRKVADAFRVSISNSIIGGSGLGMPLGLLNPNAGIPILDTSVSTPPGQITWQDLVQLKWDLPMQWHNEGSYLMNQRTWALLATTSDAIGRPLFAPSPIQNQVGFMLNGSPVQIVTQMPECLPGNTPVMYANLRQAYTLVNRSATTMTPDPYTAQFCHLFRFEARVGGAVNRTPLLQRFPTPVLYANLRQLYMLVTRPAVTMQSDPYSAGWCTLFKFDARVGGGVVCPNAARLLRIR